MKFFLTGGETEHQLNALISSNSKYITFNYNILKRSSGKEITRLLSLAKDNNAEVMIESGSSSFQSKIVSLDDTEIRALYTKEFNSYIKFLNKYKEFIDVFSTIDILKNSLNEFQCSFISEYNEIGKPFIFTPTHTFIRKENWLNITDYPRLILGIESNTSVQDIKAKLKIHHGYFRKARVKLHTWSMSNSQDLKAVPAYSSTNSTWSYGARFGTVFNYTGKYKVSRVVDKHHSEQSTKKIKTKLKHLVEKQGLNFDLFMSNDAATINSWNCNQFVSLQKDLDNKVNEYFNMDGTENKSNIIVRPKAELTFDEDTSFNEKLKQDPRSNVIRLCDTCEFMDQCPKFMENAECAYEFKLNVDNSDLGEMHQKLIGMQFDVIRHKELGTKIGATEHSDLEASISSLSKMIKTHTELLQKGGYSSSVSGKEQVSILDKLFSNASNKALPQTRTQGQAARRGKSRAEDKVILEMQEETKKEIEKDNYTDIEDAEIIES